MIKFGAILIIQRLIRVIENLSYIPDKNDLGVINEAKKFISDNFNISDVLRTEEINSDWIDVNDDFPSENEEVNVYFETVIKRTQGDIKESGVTSCIFTKNEYLRPLFAKDNGWVVLGVTHWQPLPPKP